MSSRFYEFGPFRLDALKRRLLRDGEVLALTPKAFETLLALVQNGGVVLDKDDLMKRVWPDTIVEEANLTQNVSVLRKLLGERASDRQYIVTIPGRGYRFVADVTARASEDNQLIVEKRTRSRIIVDDVIETSASVKTIGVLPFKLLGAETGDEYLGLGIADALITRLGNLRQIIVRPTSAILKYVGPPQDPVLVGHTLKVEAILEGSIQRHGDRVRVTVQLVSVSREAALWAGKFDELFTDLFTIEDRISEQIARALMLELTGEEQQRLTKHHTESAAAYQAYLKGIYFANKATAEGAQKAIECFTRAIALDANYALAYAGKADAYTWLSHLCWSPKEAMAKAREAAIEALAIDDALGEAHYALALVKLWHDWDWPGVERRFKRAIELSPNHAMVHTWYGLYLTTMSRGDEALVELQLAQEIDPLLLMTYAGMGWSLYFMRDYDRAIEQFEKALEMEPSFHSSHWGLGWSYVWKGQYDESIAHFEKARAMAVGAEIIGGLGHAQAKAGRTRDAHALLDELRQLARQQYVSPFYVALIYAGLEDKDRALEFLYQAYEDRFEWMVQLNVDPVWDFLRADARFSELLKRLGHG